MPLNYLIGRRLGITASYVTCLDMCTYLLVTRLCLAFPTPRSLALFQRSSLVFVCSVSVSLDWPLLCMVQSYSSLLLGNGTSILRYCYPSYCLLLRCHDCYLAYCLDWLARTPIVLTAYCLVCSIVLLTILPCSSF